MPGGTWRYKALIDWVLRRPRTASHYKPKKHIPGFGTGQRRGFNAHTNRILFLGRGTMHLCRKQSLTCWCRPTLLAPYYPCSEHTAYDNHSEPQCWLTSWKLDLEAFRAACYSLLSSSIRMNELQHLRCSFQYITYFLVQLIYDSLYVRTGDKNFLL